MRENPPSENNSDPNQPASDSECNGTCQKKQCQAENCKKNQKKDASECHITSHKVTLGHITETAAAYSAKPDSEMLYKRLVQHANQLSLTQRVMAAKEIAAVLKVDYRTVNRWKNEKKIHPCGGGIRSARFDILEVMEAQRLEREEEERKRIEKQKRKKSKKGKTE